MSLFPAYTSEELKKNNEENLPSEEWLKNSSYKIDTVQKRGKDVSDNVEELSQSNESKCSERKSENKLDSHKRKKKEKKKDRRSVSREISTDRYIDKHYNKQSGKEFYADKSCEKVFLTVNTIARPSRPRYICSCYFIGDVQRRSNKKQKWKRYYKHYFDADKIKSEETQDEVEVQSVENKTEIEIGKKTASYNEMLGRDPFDVNAWIEYVKFQETVWQFEKTYRKGSTAKGIRITAERKLAILDKAITHNPNNPILSRERVLVAEGVYPADELHKYLQGLVEKDSGNIILWQGYIESTQCSMAHCNAPAVITLYNRCLAKLHQLRRASKIEKSVLEEKILCMLYQCGLFLRQAGLWEQLWTLLGLYLELNLASSDKQKFNIPSKINDKHLLELEEVILNSQLPMHELWLRVEKLREGCHWLPWDKSDMCEDPQRTVFIDDVSDLIHPITSAGNTFRLTVMILTLLKGPLLPSRHSTIQELGLDYVPWALDSIELLLPVFYPVFPIKLPYKYLLKDATKLAVGPQYIKTHPGQEEYLDYFITVMRSCAECLESVERTALFLWWLRFERLLIILDKNQHFKMPTGRMKSVKNSIKEFLKDEKNRNNIVFYKEYALIEYELGNFESACKILLTAISMLCTKEKMLSTLNEEDRSNMCSLYRTLVEIHINEDNNIEQNKSKAIHYLIKLVNNTTEHININDLIPETINKFEEVRQELLQNEQIPMSVSEHFLPDFMTDWTICYGWLLYLSRSPIEAGKMIEDTLEYLEQKEIQVMWRQEVLMEWYVGIMYKMCTETLGSGMFVLFREVLYRSLKLFPNNVHILTLTSIDQSSSGLIGKPWWNLQNLLSKSGHALPSLFIIIMASQQLSQIQDDLSKTEFFDSSTAISTFSNRVLSLFSSLTKSNMCTRRCGLLWRLYLQFLYSLGNLESCRKAYYSAVEECPWLKALYIDAAIYIPAELSPIQDLIIEKQLRIHVTPEELDILRN